MFAQCPECKTPCYIDIPDLRSARGMVVCKQCSAEFNALESLSDAPAILPTKIIELSDVTLVQTWLVKFLTIQSSIFWAACLSVGLIGLGWQIYDYQFAGMSQNPKLRPWLISSCQWLNCSVPAYKNVEEISVLQGDLVLNDDNSYRFMSTLTNQALFAQPLPAIKLSMVNFVGDVIAYRIFYATDYFPAEHVSTIASNETVQITLHIAPLTILVGGYYFELV